MAAYYSYPWGYSLRNGRLDFYSILFVLFMVSISGLIIIILIIINCECSNVVQAPCTGMYMKTEGN